MSWTRYLLHDFFTASELNRIDASMRKQRMSESRVRAGQNDRLEELEDELARMALLTRALSEACLAAGVFTREQLGEILHRIDAEDGVVDGRLGGAEQNEPPQTPNQFLGELEKRERDE